MKVLLDTHCWLWSHFEPEKLSTRAAAVLEDLANAVFFQPPAAGRLP